MNYFITYPDRFIDIITPRQSNFHLFFFQRIVLRLMSRSVGSYFVFARGTSKSFLADLSRYLNCMFLPRHQATIIAGTNKQAAGIAKQKIIDDLWVRFPFLANEMQKRVVAGKIQDAYNSGADYVEFRFRNGSTLGLGNMRGLRKHSILFEEIIEQDPTKVNEVYIPLLNKSRETIHGEINPNEPHSQQLYITTAGFQGSFAYDKLIEMLCRSALDPQHYAVLLGTYRIPLACGITNARQVEDIINSPTFDRASFEREYESRWTDSPNGAAIKTSTIAAVRQVKRCELKYNLTPKQEEDGCFYVMCADMSKDGNAETIVGIAKVIPKENFFIYKVVNLLKVTSTDYMVVANEFKKLALLYQVKLMIYDANGIGSALRDWLNKETRDDVGNIYEGLGIINPPPEAAKDMIRYPDSRTICYEIKAVGRLNEKIH